MNDDALRRWAETYVRLVEELMQRGVPEDDARRAATNAANHAAMADHLERQDADPWGEEL